MGERKPLPAGVAQSQDLKGGGGADEGFKGAKTQGVTHLCRRSDGDPSQQGGYKEAVSAWEVLATPIHHANTTLQTPPPPSPGAVALPRSRRRRWLFIHAARNPPRKEAEKRRERRRSLSRPLTVLMTSAEDTGARPSWTSDITRSQREIKASTGENQEGLEEWGGVRFRSWSP